jgi:hypothetical protein
MKPISAPLIPPALLIVACAGQPPPCTTDPAAAEKIRKELEAAYAANEAAFFARDPDAVMKLRHPAFHTVDETGKLSTREQMYDRTRLFIQRILRFDMLRETIQTLETHGDTAIVTVLQETSRAQRLGDGTEHRVDTSVTQREWWRCTPQGWRMWRVDDIRNPSTLVDGKPLSQGH